MHIFTITKLILLFKEKSQMLHVLVYKTLISKKTLTILSFLDHTMVMKSEL